MEGWPARGDTAAGRFLERYVRERRTEGAALLDAVEKRLFYSFSRALASKWRGWVCGASSLCRRRKRGRFGALSRARVGAPGRDGGQTRR